jgi:ferredoxin
MAHPRSVFGAPLQGGAASGPPKPAPGPSLEVTGFELTITLANRGGASFRVDRRKPLLDTLEAQGVSLPYGCRYGGCISCAAKLLSGNVDQRAGVALNGRQLASGYVLLCIARPLTDCSFDVGVESHDKLYRNPFASPLAPHELKRGGIATPLEDAP